jgi:dipeptidyl-peptidase-4
MNILKKSAILLSLTLLTAYADAQDLKQLSNVISWRDNSSLLMMHMEKGERVYREYNINTGHANIVERPADVSRATVSVKDGDIYYKDEKGTEKRITQTVAEERNPELSPDGKVIAFTRENDLYTISILGDNEVRYTNDGSELIMNGWASWVYYEEILGRASRYKAFWWSPDSRTLAFM